MSAYFVGYTIGQIPWGLLADRFGSRRIMAASIAGVSAATVLFGFGGDFTSLAIARFLAGLLGAGSLRSLGQADRRLVRVEGEGYGPRLVECGWKHRVDYRYLGLSFARPRLRLAGIDHHTGSCGRRLCRVDVLLPEGRGKVEWSTSSGRPHSALRTEEFLGTRSCSIHPPRQLLHLPSLAAIDVKGGVRLRRTASGHGDESVQLGRYGVEPSWWCVDGHRRREEGPRRELPPARREHRTLSLFSRAVVSFSWQRSCSGG